MPMSVISRFAFLPVVARGDGLALFSFGAPALLLAAGIVESAFGWATGDDDALVTSLYCFAGAIALFWLLRLSSAVLLVRDTRRLCLPAIEAQVIRGLIVWLGLTVGAPTLLLSISGLPPAIAIVTLTSAALAGASLRLAPMGLAIPLVLCLMLSITQEFIDLLTWRGLFIAVIIDLGLIGLLWRGWRSIVAGDYWLARIGPPLVETVNARDAARRPPPWIERMARRIVYRPARSRHHYSPQYAIATALGPEFTGRGRFVVLNIVIAATTLLALLAWLSWGLPGVTGHAALHGEADTLRAYRGMPMVLAVTVLVFYPLITLAPLWRRWQAPAYELAVLAHLPGLGCAGPVKYRAVWAATHQTLFMLFIAGVNLGVVCMLIGGGAAAFLTVAGAAVGSALIFFCLALAIVAGRLPRLSYILGTLIAWVVVALTAMAYLSVALGNASGSSYWVEAALAAWAVSLVGALVIGARSLRCLRIRPHPFLPNT